jgi:hypothetical protein
MPEECRGGASGLMRGTRAAAGLKFDFKVKLLVRLELVNLGFWRIVGDRVTPPAICMVVKTKGLREKQFVRI